MKNLQIVAATLATAGVGLGTLKYQVEQQI